jgi:orotidine-5'-phosphate decarboxylase
MATPEAAIYNGSNGLVIGSAIYRAKDPHAAAQEIRAQIQRGLERRVAEGLPLHLPVAYRS